MKKKLIIFVSIAVGILTLSSTGIALAACPYTTSNSHNTTASKPCSSCQNIGHTTNDNNNTNVNQPSRLSDIIKQYKGDHTAMRDQIQKYLADRKLNRSYNISNRTNRYGTASSTKCNCGASGCTNCTNNTNCNCGSTDPNHVCTCKNPNTAPSNHYYPGNHSTSTNHRIPNNNNNSGTTSNSSYQSMESQILDLVNQYRRQNGLSALSLNNTISNVARGHSANMASGNVAFGHDGFSSRVSTLKSQIGGSAYAENVAMNRNSSNAVQTAFNGWINSPGHKKNILGNYNQTGIGVTRSQNGSYYFTQIFER